MPDRIMPYRHRHIEVKILADYRINPKVERMVFDHRFVEQVNNAVVAALEDAARRADKKVTKGDAK